MSKDELEIEVGFTFEYEDFFDFVKAEKPNQYEAMFNRFKESHKHFYDNEKDFDNPYDLTDLFAFFRETRRVVFHIVWDKFKDSEYPHSHYLIPKDKEEE